jgi:hypothetical protein
MSAQQPPTLLSLSPRRRRLVDLMRFVTFGRIENLAFRDGEPAFEFAPIVVRTIKAGAGRNAIRPTRKENFLLKDAVTELLDHMAKVGNGTVRKIEIGHGLPLNFEVEESVSGRQA